MCVHVWSEQNVFAQNKTGEREREREMASHFMINDKDTSTATVFPASQ